MLNRFKQSKGAYYWMASFSLILLISTVLFAGTYDPTNEQEAMQRTLRRMDILIVQVGEHAAELNALANKTIPSFRAHGFELDQARAEMNDFGELIPKLQEMSKDVDWSKQPVDRIAADAKALASELETAINRVNKLRSSTELMLDKDYQVSVAAMSRFSDEIEEMIDYLQSRMDLES